MNHHTNPINEKAPSAINTEGLVTDSTNDLNLPLARDTVKRLPRRLHSLKSRAIQSTGRKMAGF